MNIKMYADQTPTQQQFLRSPKLELEMRTRNGEKNLMIKYIKGVPKIIVNNYLKN